MPYSIYYNGKMIGSIELVDINFNDMSAHISCFIISDEHKNKGLGTLAFKELLNTAFSEMNLIKLLLRVYCFNIGAIRIYEKCGFVVREYFEKDDNLSSYIMELNSDKYYNHNLI